MISTVFAETPVTTPVVALTVAIVLSLLLHAPPPVVLDRLVVEPIHTLSVPLIAAGNGLIVIVLVL
jgi:hypothetical protein